MCAPCIRQIIPYWPIAMPQIEKTYFFSFERMYDTKFNVYINFRFGYSLQAVVHQRRLHKSQAKVPSVVVRATRISLRSQTSFQITMAYLTAQPHIKCQHFPSFTYALIGVLNKLGILFKYNYVFFLLCFTIYF